MKYLVLSAICALCLTGCGGPPSSPNKNVAQNAVPQEIKSSAPTIKVYVENSGSMDGYVKGATDFENAEYISTTPGNGVRYIVPQKMNIHSSEDIKLYFRVSAVYKNAKVVLEADGKVISSKKKVKLAPGEMENVTVPADVIASLTKDSTVCVRVEE